MAGEIVTRGFHEASDKELAVVAAVRCARPVREVFRELRLGHNLAADTTVMAHGEFRGGRPSLADLSGVNFTEAEASEIQELIEARPGDRFNLDAGEISIFERLRNRFGGGNCVERKDCRAAVINGYREILLHRAMEFYEGGISAIRPYVRGRTSKSDPGSELRGSIAAATLLHDRFPLVARALTASPSQETVAEHQLLWMKQKIQGRPSFTLVHRVFLDHDNHAMMAEKRFYVGHGYNSSLIIQGSFAVEDGTLVLYTNRTSTDQVAGFGSSMRHVIGRKKMASAIIQSFRDIRDHTD
jgi:hypothetical protein